MFRVLLTNESESDKRWCLHGLSVEKQLSVPGVSSASWYLRRGSGQHRPETRAPDPGHSSHPQLAGSPVPGLSSGQKSVARGEAEDRDKDTFAWSWSVPVGWVGNQGEIVCPWSTNRFIKQIPMLRRRISQTVTVPGCRWLCHCRDPATFLGFSNVIIMESGKLSRH